MQTVNKDVPRNESFAANTSIRDSKDPLHKYFDWSTLEKDHFLQKWNTGPQAQTFIEDVIRYLSMNLTEQKKYLRANNVSANYREHYEYLKNAFPVLNANPTGLTIDQILGQDRHFHRTYYNNNTFAQILSTVPGCTRVLEGGKKWEIKHHDLTNYEWPKFTRDFTNLGVVNVGPEGVKSSGMGWGAEYRIPFTVIEEAAGGIYDIDYWHIFFLSTKMGIFGDERGWLGSKGENTTGKGATNLYGLHNWTDLAGNTATATQLPGGGSTDEVLTAGKADFDDLFVTFLGNFRTYKVYGGGKNVLVSTSGISDEMFVNDSAVGAEKTLYQMMQDKWFRSGQVDSWWVTNNLEYDTNALTNQRVMMMKLSPNYIKRTIVYPLQRKAIMDKRYSDDVAFAYITGDILQVYQHTAISVCAGDCTSSNVGWSMNGKFMDSNTQGQRIPGIYA